MRYLLCIIVALICLMILTVWDLFFIRPEWNPTKYVGANKSKSVKVGRNEFLMLKGNPRGIMSVSSNSLAPRNTRLYGSKRIEPKFSCPTTIVTAYFDVPSKFPRDQYMTWMKNFFSIQACVVVFTDEGGTFSSISSDHVHVIEVSLAAKIQRFNQSTEFWKKQFEIDPERDIHKSFQLYWIWNLKPTFVMEAVNLGIFRSSYYMWLDVGVFRDSSFDGQDLMKLVPPASFDAKFVHYGSPGEFEDNELILDEQGKCLTNFSDPDKDRVAGGIFTLTAEMARVWQRTYDLVFLEYVQRGWFVGKDQNVIATACIEYSEVCKIVPNVNVPGNKWYIMIYYMFGLMPGARGHRLLSFCKRFLHSHLPLSSSGQKRVHHYEAETGMWNEDDRWRPLKLDRGSIMYIGGNTHGLDGIRLAQEHPGMELHIYEPVPSFFGQLVAHWKQQKLHAHFHNYGLGMYNQTLYLNPDELKGQSTFIMNAGSKGKIMLVVKDAAYEFRTLSSAGSISLLHMNCEGCEWDFFDSWIKEDILPKVPNIQFSLHYLPLNRPLAQVSAHYCKVHNALSKTHTLEFGPPFGWQRWTLKKRCNLWNLYKIFTEWEWPCG